MGFRTLYPLVISMLGVPRLKSMPGVGKYLKPVPMNTTLACACAFGRRAWPQVFRLATPSSQRGRCTEHGVGWSTSILTQMRGLHRSLLLRRPC